MSEVLLTGITFGESPRWHDGRLWFCDWVAGEVIAVDAAGTSEVVLRVPFGLPFCIDWLPDGRMLAVDGPGARLMRLEPDGTLVPHADLSGVAAPPWNDIAVDARGNAYVSGIGYTFPGGEPRTGFLALATPDGEVTEAARDVSFPNGLVVTPDGSTLILAESHAARLTAWDVEPDGSLTGRRVWADLGEGAAPDGICLDAEGAVWYGDVPNRRCVRVREGGEVLQTVDLDLGCFACALGGHTLYMVAADWSDPARMMSEPTGRVHTEQVAVPGL
ncbi:SMP-30/gluconolactonase/LRE family protein [Actinocorallia longicatena]|uniref:SMP-30/gluconolactonase/LRE family protein n=1 Tax=Actinocorallia longicatena TaxID=111803 RepID=A0ABP6QKM1_9ACTN